MSLAQCQNFEENYLINNGICIKCYRHRDYHQSPDPYYEEKTLRTQIEDTLYYTINEIPKKLNVSISELLGGHSLPPPQIYYKVFNVYSYVNRNLTNPNLSSMTHEEKLIAMFHGVDFLLVIALPLRRPPSFEKVSKLRRTIPDMQKAERLDGTIDVINKLGYTVVTRDHFEFPQEVQAAPDQTLIRELIADLMIAMKEIQNFHDKRHTNPERFTDWFEWAKKTTPILPDTSYKQPFPPTRAKEEPFPTPQVPSSRIDHIPFSKSDSYPPPSIDTIECPFCQAVLPKKTTVCDKCRKCIPSQFKPGIDLIPVEQWTCKSCTVINSTARGRTRVCSTCQLTDSMSDLDITTPNLPTQDNTQRRDSLPNRNPSANPVLNPSGQYPIPSGSFREPPTMRPNPTFMNEPFRQPQRGPIEPAGPPLDKPMDPSVSMRNFPDDHSRYAGDNAHSMYLPQGPTPADHNIYDPRADHSVYDQPPRHYAPPGGGRISESLGLGYHLEPRMPFSPYSQPKQFPHKRVKQILSQNSEFKDEAIQLAIKTCGVEESIRWLRSQFRDNIGILAIDAQQLSLCKTVTSQDVEESYLACQGYMTDVLLNIQNSRKNKLDELVTSFKVDESMAISSLDDTNWEIPAARENILLTCNQQQIDTYRPHLWRDGMTIPEQDKPVEDINPVLWEQLIICNTETKDMDPKIVRKFLCEFKVPSFLQLNLLLQLLVSDETKDKDPKELLQAVKEISEFDAAVKFLNQECCICMLEYTANDMIQMFFCEHSACKTCIVDYFSGVIRGSAIKNWVCFECAEPDISQMDDPSDYFALLSNVVQVMCETDVSNLFHQKVNEFYLSKRPEFRWCPHCHSGFMGLEGEKKLRCPQEECKEYMCYICKNKWHVEHEGRSCEEFQEWREANDRDILDKGLAARMVDEGIECPSCKFKYELARGGCMHFRCTQCPAEFCSGCFQLFKKDNCTKFPSCAKKGLHAHHPRNCQYFTRDMDIAKMKELLELGGFLSDAAILEAPAPADGAPANPAKKQQIYKIKVPDEHRNRVIEELTAQMGDKFVEPPKGELKIPCQIVEYKESPGGGFEKEDCSKFSYEKDGCAGLCDKHYKEYICGLITKAGLDPIDVLQVTAENIFELFAILRRNEIPFDDKMNGDALKQLIKEKLPLQPMKVKGALQA